MVQQLDYQVLLDPTKIAIQVSLGDFFSALNTHNLIFQWLMNVFEERRY